MKLLLEEVVDALMSEGFVSLDKYSLYSQFIIIRSMIFYPKVLEEYRKNYGVIRTLSSLEESNLRKFVEDLLPYFSRAVELYETSNDVTGIEISELAFLILNKKNMDVVLDQYPKQIKNVFLRHIKDITEEELEIKTGYRERYGDKSADAVKLIKRNLGE